jgi:hypothetical protein
MEQIQEELATSGYDVVMTAINIGNAEYDQWALLSKCTFPLFQDTLDDQALIAHGIQKDDFLIYGKDNLLHQYLPAMPTTPGAVSTHLGTIEGKTNLINAITAAFDD